MSATRGSEQQLKSTYAQNGRSGADSIHASKALGTFTGEVWFDPILKENDMSMLHVNFQPGARTHWHRHEKGQILKVTAGSGWVCDRGEKPKRIAVGDVIWCPAGGVHWHGADDGSFMVHEAISLGGLDWYEAVSDEVYAAKNR